MGTRKREEEREEGEKQGREREQGGAEEQWRKIDKLALYPSFLTDGT